jgi:hypothetical protein
MRLNAAEMRTVDLSDDDVTTTHLRFLTGGGGAKVENERLFQFVFPEKPGSLKVRTAAIQRHAIFFKLRRINAHSLRHAA